MSDSQRIADCIVGISALLQEDTAGLTDAEPLGQAAVVLLWALGTPPQTAEQGKLYRRLDRLAAGGARLRLALLPGRRFGPGQDAASPPGNFPLPRAQPDPDSGLSK